MDYEEFYQQAQTLEKVIKDKLQNAQKSFKSILKNTEKGDLKSLSKDLTTTQAILSEYEKIINDIKDLMDQFDVKEYMESGEFARQMVEYCEENSVDVKGDFPVYEMFPYKIKIDSENQDLYVDRKKVQCARPSTFVKDIKQSQDKLKKAAFNENAFINELMAAYDSMVKIKSASNSNIQPDCDLLLRDLYDYLTPMQRFRRDYDLQSYALDLSRLYSSDVERTKDGRKIEFGTSKKANKLIRILDQNGGEQFLGTVRFYRVSE